MRESAARARLDAERAALRRAVLGAQLVLRAHVLRDVARLGAHRRDRERRERHEPREDRRVGRALGGGAQEAPAWSRRPVSHAGVLVTEPGSRDTLSTIRAIISVICIYSHLSDSIYMFRSPISQVVCHFIHPDRLVCSHYRLLAARDIENTLFYMETPVVSSFSHAAGTCD